MNWVEGKPKEDGYYWWRFAEEDMLPEIVRFHHGMVGEFGSDMEYYEHTDFSGEFAGPLIPPP